MGIIKKPKMVYIIFLIIIIFLTGILSFAEQQGGRGKVVQLEEITIEGKVPKPNAFYVLTRSNLAFEKRELKKSFVNEVIQSVNKDPF